MRNRRGWQLSLAPSTVADVAKSEGDVTLGGKVNEHTLIKTLPLPFGQMWTWYGDANVLALSPNLRTEAERQAAITEALAHWRRNFIRVVPDPGATMPMARLSPWHGSESSPPASGMPSSATQAGGA